MRKEALQENTLRRCAKCNEAKSLEMFHRHKNNAQGREYTCKSCRRTQGSIAIERQNANIPSGMKRCSKCAEVKPLEMFNRRAMAKCGYVAQCRNCESAYREANAETRKAKNKAYRDANRERCIAYSRAWRRDNPVKVSKGNHTRRARNAVNGGSYTAAEMQALQTAQNGHCAYCQRTGYALHIEHIIPVKQGGPSWIWNICLACRKCNLNKGNKTPQQWVNRWYLQ